MLRCHPEQNEGSRWCAEIATAFFEWPRNDKREIAYPELVEGCRWSTEIATAFFEWPRNDRGIV